MRPQQIERKSPVGRICERFADSGDIFLGRGVGLAQF